MIYLYVTISFSHKKLSVDKCYNKGEPWKQYGKEKKPNTKGHILDDSIYVKCLE